MAQRFFNEFSKENTVAFWITIGIGIVLLACLVFLFLSYTALLF